MSINTNIRMTTSFINVEYNVNIVVRLAYCCLSLPTQGKISIFVAGIRVFPRFYSVVPVVNLFILLPRDAVGYGGLHVYGY